MTNVVNLSGVPEATNKLTLDPKIQDSIVLRGDLSGLNEGQKRDYYLYRCRQVGLDPAAKPFDLLTLNGKQILYANASATQQLCAIHKLSTQITHRERIDGIYVVSVRCTGADGRVSENQGAVDVSSLTGERLANALLKATTKAIRRSVLAHVGLGMLDETEVETIPEARRDSIVVTEDPKAIEVEAQEPQSGIVFMVPGATEPYCYCENNDEWVDTYLQMVEKISESTKFNIGAKMDKLEKLWEANDFIISLIKEEKHTLYEVLSNGIGKVKQKLALELREPGGANK
jgi:hypothetical protein